jgi:hypothetical protein
MARKVWFQLVDAATRGAYADTQAASVSSDGVSDIDDLRGAIRGKYHREEPDILKGVIADQLRVYADRKAYDAKKNALDEDSPIGTLGRSKKKALVVEVPTERESDVSAVELFQNGLNPEVPHLARVQLLESIYASMMSGRNRFLLFISPAASGKTSLLSLFARRYRKLKCVAISFLRVDVSAADMLLSCGIDVFSGKTSLSSAEDHVVMVDDAQAKYDDKGFWSTLIKVAPWKLPSNIRFIICATHALEGGVESPVEFQSLVTFGRRDFLLSDAEAEEFLRLPRTGLPERMQKRNVIQLLIRECSGLVGALRNSVDAVAPFFAKDPAPAEPELVAYCLSQECMQLMARCFGSQHMTPTSLELRQFLIECLIAAPNIVSLKSDEDNRCLVTLKKAGIIVEDADRLVRFSSPLAEKYYSKWLFPNRALVNPTLLRDLIESVVGNMSASVLQQSVVDATNFPKEATFQHQFMEGLALNTHPGCSICPELSRVFSDGDQALRIEGEIDFYLDGDLRWGLELLVNGDKIGEHMARFAPGGKYAALAVNDYAVIDLRGNETGKVTNVSRMEKRFTVFFQLSDFSRCRCIFGMDEDIYDITLQT